MPRSFSATRLSIAPRSAAVVCRRTAYSATGEPPLKDTPALEARDGPLRIAPTVNGPLKLEGNAEIVTGTGHTIDRTTRVFLCRCGHSANKPFWDSSHKRVGFVG
nr:CDGSH iron-sulfur domain-containing protein [Mesorhizobium sp.]